jgi:signal transduction histidine kinase
LIKRNKEKQKIMPLNMKLFIAVVVALISVIALFFINERLSQYVVDDIYLSDNMVSKRDKENIQDFSRYVNANDLSGKDSQMIDKWQDEHDYMSVMIFQNNKIVFDSQDVLYNTSGENQTDVEDYYKKYYHFFLVQFKDGAYDVVIIDYSDVRVYDILTIINLITCCLIFVLFILYIATRQVKRIRRLSIETNEIESYDISAAITKSGNDEITVLADGIDRMRNKIVDQLSREKEAWQANSDLVTSMAHDIRTPLTVLSGYLDLLNTEEELTPEERRQYTDMCVNKVSQLKDMSDKLFNFFFVYSKSDMEIKLEEYNAVTLLQQMIGEFVVLYEEQGFRFDVSGLNQEVLIRVDLKMLRRMFDNVFSNISKYADKENTVYVDASEGANAIHIKIRNTIKNDRSEAISTMIGLKTCKKIAEELKSDFWTEESKKSFIVHILIPKVVSNV